MLFQNLPVVSFASGVIHFPINVGKAYAGVMSEPYKGAKEDGWRGFGKGLGLGLIGLFPRRGIVVHGKAYGIRALYLAIKKRIGSGTLSFILATHFAQGFQDVKASTEEERSEVLKQWRVLAPVLEREQSGSSTANSVTLEHVEFGELNENLGMKGMASTTSTGR